MIRFFPRASACLLLVLMGAGAAQAQGSAPVATPTPTHLALARELEELQGSMNTAETFVREAVEQIRRQAITRPEIQKDLEEVITGLRPELEAQRQQLINRGAVVYAKWLTESDLREILAFYKSPIGQKFLKVQPEIGNDLSGEVASWMQLMSEYMMVRVRADMSKRGKPMQ